jgi:hypothetical protein
MTMRGTYQRCYECGANYFGPWGHARDCPEYPRNDPTHPAKRYVSGGPTRHGGDS